MSRSLLPLACGLMLLLGVTSTATAGFGPPTPNLPPMQQPLKPTKRVLKAPAVTSPSQFLKTQNAVKGNSTAHITRPKPQKQAPFGGPFGMPR